MALSWVCCGNRGLTAVPSEISSQLRTATKFSLHHLRFEKIGTRHRGSSWVRNEQKPGSKANAQVLVTCMTTSSSLSAGSRTIPVESRTHAAFLALLDAARADSKLKLVPIRMRATDLATAFDGGDYDFVLSPHAHPDFLRMVVEMMRTAEVSFTIDHRKPGKRRLLLHAPEANRDITIELWSHLEVRDPARRCARSIPW